MHLDPLVVQASISIPLALGFALYSASRRDRSPLHALAAGLVFCLVLWITTLLRAASATRAPSRSCASGSSLLTSLVIAPLFVVMMGYSPAIRSSSRDARPHWAARPSSPSPASRSSATTGMGWWWQTERRRSAASTLRSGRARCSGARSAGS